MCIQRYFRLLHFSYRCALQCTRTIHVHTLQLTMSAGETRGEEVGVALHQHPDQAALLAFHTAAPATSAFQLHKMKSDECAVRHK